VIFPWVLLVIDVVDFDLLAHFWYPIWSIFIIAGSYCVCKVLQVWSIVVAAIPARKQEFCFDSDVETCCDHGILRHFERVEGRENVRWLNIFKVKAIQGVQRLMVLIPSVLCSTKSPQSD